MTAGGPRAAGAPLPRVRRGEVWLTALDPTVGSEIQKTRPCMVVSPPDLHDHLRTAVVAPMSTGSRPAAFRVPVGFAGKQGFVLLDQVRTVDRQRMVRRLGAVAPGTLAAALAGLRDLFED